jgi:hypothetical protein
LKLVIQIALGVFLGALASEALISTWHSYRDRVATEAESARLAEQEKARIEGITRAQELIAKQLQRKVEEDKKRRLEREAPTARQRQDRSETPLSSETPRGN